MLYGLPQPTTTQSRRSLQDILHFTRFQYIARRLNLGIRGICVLAIETSCDDTCVAVLHKSYQGGQIASLPPGRPSARLLFNKKITADNRAFRGIHPIESLNSHRKHLAKLVEDGMCTLPVATTCQNAERVFMDREGIVRIIPDLVAVTRGPGMRSNLNVGLDTAKGLATAWQISLVGVHHMLAHTLTPRLVTALKECTELSTCSRPMSSRPEERERPGADHQRDEAISASKEPDESWKPENTKPDFPFLTLLVSGGHTMLVLSKGLTDHQIMANTKDIAVGDALDKLGRSILPTSILDQLQDTSYARYMSAYAFETPAIFHEYPVPRTRGAEMVKDLNSFGWAVNSPLANTRELAFSFTGITSRIVQLLHSRSLQQGSITDHERRTFARAAVGTAFEHLASRTTILLEMLRIKGESIKTLVISGGVAASPFLQHFFREFLDIRGFPHVELTIPPPEYCTDNAAMIAWTGIELFEAGFRSDLGCNALARWSMDSTAEEGGILGVGGWAST